MMIGENLRFFRTSALYVDAVAVVTCFVSRARAEDAASVLVLDVYSVKVPSDVAHEKGFALWAKSLKAGGESSREHDSSSPSAVLKPLDFTDCDLVFGPVVKFGGPETKEHTPAMISSETLEYNSNG
jgi:hypothetical protein